jgi:hypothetical protein
VRALEVALGLIPVEVWMHKKEHRRVLQTAVVLMMTAKVL